VPTLENGASSTAEATAAMRAAESIRPVGRRLLTDPVAKDLVRRPLYRLWARSPRTARMSLWALDRIMPGAPGHVMYRCRYSDAAIERVTAAGVGQIVILGAGFDTSAFRLAVPATFFEVDVPSTQATKRERLAGTGHQPVSEVVFVPCRLGTDNLAECLREAGFRSSEPVLVVWLGVTMYLTLDAIAATVADLRDLSAAGSELVVDYIDAAVLDRTSGNRRAELLQPLVARLGEPVHTGFRAAGLREFLSEYGFAVREDLGMLDLLARYPTADPVSYSTADWIRIASAERQA
jgi:methyltransferase (TIGR00027 family)